MSFEKLLIFHCSPTLASIKTANLFSFHYESDTDLKEHVNYWDFQMREKGVCLAVMRNRNQKALIYVYRTSELEKILGDESTRSFLDRYGYKGLSLEESLERLQKRLEQQEGFPHEIGIFLGYPLEDVAGFIYNEGKTFFSQACGRYMETWRKQEEPSADLKNVQISTCVCGTRGKAFNSLLLQLRGCR